MAMNSTEVHSVGPIGFLAMCEIALGMAAQRAAKSKTPVDDYIVFILSEVVRRAKLDLAPAQVANAEDGDGKAEP